MDVIQIEMIHKRQNENIAVFFAAVIYTGRLPCARGLFLDLFRDNKPY